jgi:hypothetical protein
MFFVLSCGRSGSQTAAETFSQFPNCICLHEPLPQLIRESTDYFCGRYPRAQVAELLRSTRQPTLDGKVYGESNLTVSLLIPVVDEVFPTARFIWLIRDGRDFVASAYYRGWYDPDVNHMKEWQAYRLRGDHTGDFTPEAWQRLSRFEKCCWVWKKYNTVIEAELNSRDRARWTMVKLESFKHSLPALASFLGITLPPRVLVEKHNTAVQPVCYWESWTPDMRAQFDAQCGEEMDRWYPEWRTTDGQWQKIEAVAADRPGVLERVGQRIKRRLRPVIERVRVSH